MRLELEAAGPTKLAFDGEVIASPSDSVSSALGKGTLVELKPGNGEHELVVISCRSETTPHGFYLLRRPTL